MKASFFILAATLVFASPCLAQNEEAPASGKVDGMFAGLDVGATHRRPHQPESSYSSPSRRRRDSFAVYPGPTPTDPNQSSEENKRRVQAREQMIPALDSAPPAAAAQKPAGDAAAQPAPGLNGGANQVVNQISSVLQQVKNQGGQASVPAAQKVTPKYSVTDDNRF